MEPNTTNKVVHNSIDRFDIYVMKIVLTKDTNALRKILEDHGKDNCSHDGYDYFIATIIRKIISFGNIEMFKIILYEYDCNILYVHYHTFATCVECGQIEMIKLLIDYGVNVNERIYNYIKQGPYVPIMFAAFGHRINVFKFLFENGADPNTDSGQTLYYCAKEGLTDFIKIMIDYGANITVGNNIAIVSAILGCHTNTTELLLQNGADINEINKLIYPDKKSVELMNLLVEKKIPYGTIVSIISLGPKEKEDLLKPYESIIYS